MPQDQTQSPIAPPQNGALSNGNGDDTTSKTNGNGLHETHGETLVVPDEAPQTELQQGEAARQNFAQMTADSGSGSTGWTPGFRAQTASERALKFARHFTKAGEDPFETARWEKRTASITGENGKSVFEQKDCEIPAQWSQLATNVVVSKYFRGAMDSPARETSVRQVIGRVADTIHDWGNQGGYFQNEGEAQSFRDELVYLLLHQYGAFNSPVWFNLGVKGARAQASACFINSVYDDMESIMELAATEARLFKGGSGAGTNLFRIRSSREQLSGGGIASGPVSFMRGWDSFAGAIKSGGTCLAPYQRVYTESGPVAVEELARRESFITLSFDPPANRFKAKRARAWHAGQKRVVRVETDKGQFDLSFDHPVKLSSGEFVQAGSLEAGMSLFACSIDEQHGHLRVHLRDGQKGKEFLHRLIATDVLGHEMEGMIVHHRDGDKHNNAPDNLEVMTQAQHAALHGRQSALRGEHIFQTSEWSHAGTDNGMHRDGAFWTGEAASAYRQRQSDILTQSGRAVEMQREAARQKSLNSAFRVLNAGWPIETFDQYARGRKAVIGRIASLSQLREQLDDEFGSYDEFRREVARQNHRVVSVSTIGEMDVYDVEVECPTPDDKSPQTGHNFLIWNGNERTGSGVIISNTRRAAKMVILNADHPDIAEFIVCKANEEKKAWALIDAGYNGGFNVPGGAYDSVAFQNANHSVRVSDEFMRAAENGASWSTRAVTTGKVVEEKNARDMLRLIAETTHICGDPGLQYDTTLNDWHTCPNTGRINASNPCCVTGDTLVAVADGRVAVPIRELVGTETPVFAHDHATGKTTVSRMWNISVKRQNVPVFKVTLDDGSTFRATDDHLIMLRDGSYKMVRDLNAGDSLMPFHSKVLAPDSNRTKRRFIWNGASWTPQYRAIWNAQNGEQPARTHIHHADFDALNDAPSNLVLMSADEHNALHVDKMRGDNNPARRLMNDQWRQNIARAVSGENNPNFGKTHSDAAKAQMSSKAKARFESREERDLASQRALDWMEEARVQGRKLGRTPKERQTRCCPVCRQNFGAARETQVFCTNECRQSPMGRAMIGAKGGAAKTGRTLSPETRAKLSVAVSRASDPAQKARAARASNRASALKAARLLLDNGVEPSLASWETLRLRARDLGDKRVPHAATVSQLFSGETELREAAMLYNHKVVSVEACGFEDVYDGTVDTHHNFAILTSKEESSAKEHQNFSGIFIHNSEFVFLDDTACLTQDVRVSTPEGLRTMGELWQAQQDGEQIRVSTDLVSEHDHRRLLSHRRAWVTQTGEKPVFAIELNDGRRIRATGNHRFLTEDGWKRVDALTVGRDRIEIRKSGNAVSFSSDEGEVARWRMLGWLSGDGVFSKGNVALVFGGQEELTARSMEAEFNRLLLDSYAFVQTAVPVSPQGEAMELALPRGGCHLGQQASGVWQITSKSRALVTFLEEWYGFHQGTAVHKDVPHGLHRVADDLKVAYLQGLFSADGCIRCDARSGNEEVMLASSSPEMLRSVQLLLADLGIASRTGWTHPQGRKNPQGQLHIYNQQARTFLSLVGFACSGSKQARAEEILSRPFEGQLKNPRAAKVVSIVPDGVEMVYDLTEPVTHSFIAEGLVTHNCNLASINLLKFYDFETGHFDAPAYVHACETFLTAQEIIVSFASYPTAKIAENSELYRPLGLGYCNIGALLMAMGLAYDSDEGRAFAGALTAIMTGAAYCQSARIARNTGPFDGYARNREPMLRVIGKHRDAVSRIDHSLVAPNVMEEAHKCWDEAFLLGQKHGYRNSQTSVLAPTGTISFMMDADTTGVEPDIALVKYKKLVGGGLLKIVNQTVPAALRKLGYDESEIKTIVEYIDKNDTIEGAPGLEDKHLSVFDCAFKAMNGVRSIHHMGHVKMMAAAQPFLSGAISKTVNMPQDCTVDEIMDAYIQSWKLGVKAVAIYRDNSKRTQPLSTSSDAQKADKKETEVRKAMRRKLPDERNSITHKFSIAGQEGYFMVGLYEDGSPGEIFIKMSKEGSTISGLMDSFAVAISMCLQYGVPLRVLVNKFSHTRFEPSGYTTNRDIPIAKSLMDYIFRWFDQKFHPNGDNGHIGKVAHSEDGADSKKADRAPASSAQAPASPSLFSASSHEAGARNGNLADAQASLMQSQADSPPCPNCGAITVRSGACYKCNECGTTTGCG